MKKDNNKVKVVIVGGGFAGVNFYKELHSLSHEDGNIEFIFISDNNYFLFTPLLHEVATGNLFPEDITLPIREAIKCCVGEVILDKVISFDAYKKVVHLEREDIKFDYLVLATGSSVNFWGIEGAQEYSVPLKTINDSIKMKNRIIELFEIADEKKLKNIEIVVVGGGATGIEVATEISEFAEVLIPFYENLKINDTRVSIKILNSSEKFIPDFPEKVRKKIKSILSREDSSVKILTDAKVMRVSEEEVFITKNKKLKYDLLIWSAGVKPNVPESNIPDWDVKKRISVNEYFNIPGFDKIFAIGDVSDFKGIDGVSLPQLAQIAEEEGKACAQNLYNSMKGNNIYPFEYNLKGLLLSLGHKNAVVSIKGVIITGKFAWILWKFIYLSLMFSTRSRFRVFVEWIYDQTSPRNISKI